MKDCRYEDRLQDLFDGALPPDQEVEVADHLRRCDVCAASWDAWLALRTAASDLPTDLPPDRDLWSGIAARIAASQASPDAEDAITRPAAARTRHAGGHRWLAVAAVLAFALLAGLQLRDRGDDNPYDALTLGYTTVRDDCRAGLEGPASELPAETRSAVGESLDLIDRAIHETQDALDGLAAAPTQANRLVAGYHKKMDLLQNLARLASQ